MTPNQARLVNFLVNAFSGDELRRFIDLYPRVAPEIGSQSSLAQMAQEFVAAMARRAELDDQLRESLLTYRPRRIDEIRSLFSDDHSAAGVQVTAQPFELPPAGQLLIQISINSWFRNIPRGLADELATLYPKISQVERIVESASRLLRDVLPGRKSLSIADIAMLSTREAWESTIRESAKISPQALAAVLVAAREETEIDLPLTRKTLSLLLQARKE